MYLQFKPYFITQQKQNKKQEITKLYLSRKIFYVNRYQQHDLINTFRKVNCPLPICILVGPLPKRVVIDFWNIENIGEIAEGLVVLTLHGQRTKN